MTDYLFATNNSCIHMHLKKTAKCRKDYKRALQNNYNRYTISLPFPDQRHQYNQKNFLSDHRVYSR